MYASTLQTLPLAVLLRSRSRGLTDFIGGRILTYRWGRDAIWWALGVLGIGPGDHVLLPASCCDVMLLPFVERGVHVGYYGLDDGLRFHLDEIAAKVELRTRAVYVIHYFGFPQELAVVRDLCRRLGLHLIEDCAHALLGRDGRIPLGEFGDVAIFSLRKMLPVPDGGCLKLNADYQRPRAGRARAEFAAAVAAAKLIAYYLAQRGIVPIGSLRALLARGDSATDGAPYWTAYRRHDQDMSAISRRILASLDPGEVAARRREHFAYWLASLPRDGRLQPLYRELPDGVVPYSFPILVDGAERVLACLRAKGIYLEPTFNAPWYNLPGLTNGEERFPAVERAAQRLISLPVHQAASIPLLDRVRAEIGKVLCESP